MNTITDRLDTLSEKSEAPVRFSFPLSREEKQRIHNASMKVLGETGFKFDCYEALEVFKSRGFKVEGKTVFFTEEQVLNAMESATKEFTILARNPERNIRMAPGVHAFGTGRGAVLMVQPDGSYERTTLDDLIQVTKLTHMLDVYEHWNPLTFPSDRDMKNIYLEMLREALTLTDKPPLYIGDETIDLIALSYGVTREEMKERNDLSVSYGRTTAIVTSPLTMVEEDCLNLMEYARCGIALHMASMPVAATTGPCTLAGMVVLQNCENLAPLVLTQLIRPGTPVYYGAIGGRADMQTLRPRFGAAETRLIERSGVQMGRFYGLLCRGGAGLTDSPTCDFQGGAQAMLSTLSVLQDGPNFLPACGLLASYVGASLAKLVLDAEVIAQAKRILEPITLNENTLAVDVIKTVGPGGYYIDQDHTLMNYRTEFLADEIFRSPDYEGWRTRGKKEAVHVAHEKALRIIESYEKPPIDQGLEEEMEAYIKAHWK